jgi:hypothetical protein
MPKNGLLLHFSRTFVTIKAITKLSQKAALLYNLSLISPPRWFFLQQRPKKP